MNKLVNGLCVTLLPVLIAGCGATHAPYHSSTEIPQGPGMFSGREGAFVFSTDRKQDKMTAEQSGSEAEYQEFRDYQQFKRWKEANRDTPEHKEFREWQEWKAYRAWKKDGS